MTNLFTYTAPQPPTDVRTTVLTPPSVEVTWTVSSSSDVTGYLVSYTTTAAYVNMNDRSKSVMVNGNSATLSNLEESTLYTITVQATTDDDNRMSGNSDPVSVTTYTAGK